MGSLTELNRIVDSHVGHEFCALIIVLYCPQRGPEKAAGSVDTQFWCMSTESPTSGILGIPTMGACWPAMAVLWWSPSTTGSEFSVSIQSVTIDDILQIQSLIASIDFKVMF